ncbi:MAG: hypothetical protein AABY07_02775, partial [Nanoarchaeota archaeon]
MVVLRLNIAEWLKYGDAINGLLDYIPEGKFNLLNNISDRFIRTIHGEMVSKNTIYTSTYYNSLQKEFIGTRYNPEFHIVINPVGPQADRLHIYWKTLEFGSQPIPFLASKPIVDWAESKFGDASAGYRIANKIRKMGVTPHPVLQSIFQLSPNGEVVGLSNLGVQIIEEESVGIMNELRGIFISTIIKTGRIVKRGPGG